MTVNGDDTSVYSTSSVDLSSIQLGLAKGDVRVVPHDPRWPIVFETERQSLQTLFTAAKIDVSIEHVGSTAIAGLAAKPVIDIALGLRSHDDVRECMRVMLESGRVYIKSANQPGMLFLAKGDPRQVFYHLVIRYTPAWDRLILVRTHLKRHPGIAREYGELKVALADEYPKSRLRYTHGKDNFIKAVLARAHHEFRRKATASAVRRSQSALTDYLRIASYNPGLVTQDPISVPREWVGFLMTEHFDEIHFLRDDEDSRTTSSKTDGESGRARSTGASSPEKRGGSEKDGGHSFKSRSDET